MRRLPFGVVHMFMLSDAKKKSGDIQKTSFLSFPVRANNGGNIGGRLTGGGAGAGSGMSGVGVF